MDEFLKFWPIINMVLMAGGGMLWFMIIEARKQTKETQKELSDFRVAVAKEYSTREEMRIALAHIDTQLQRLNEKLDKMREIG